MEERAGRILDAAASLLLRWGYRKITVEDIAREAGVGKGTVYLHWKTKQEVFYAVLMRDGAELFDEVLDWMRADPARVLPGPMAARTYLASMGRPLSKALYTSDVSILGELVVSQPGFRQYTAALREHYFGYLDLLRANGCVRDDLDNGTFLYLLDSVSVGFFMVQDTGLMAADLSHEKRAEVLADTIDRVVAPAGGQPDRRRLAEIAEAAIDHLEQLRNAFVGQAAEPLPKP